MLLNQVEIYNSQLFYIFIKNLNMASLELKSNLREWTDKEVVKFVLIAFWDNRQNPKKEESLK